MSGECIEMSKQIFQLADRKQFEAVFIQYNTELVVYLYKYVLDTAVAEDIVQELFCELWTKRLKLEINTNVRAFLFRSARNAAINYLTRQKRLTVEMSRQMENEIVFREDLETIERDRKLYEMIERLPEQRKKIFKMCFFEELRYQDVALKLDISINTVKTQMGRALTELRESAGELIFVFLVNKIKKVK